MLNIKIWNHIFRTFKLQPLFQSEPCKPAPGPKVATDGVMTHKMIYFFPNKKHPLSEEPNYAVSHKDNKNTHADTY